MQWCAYELYSCNTVALALHDFFYIKSISIAIWVHESCEFVSASSRHGYILCSDIKAVFCAIRFSALLNG